jgi:hypothetical protein
MIGELWIGKAFERSGRGLILILYPGIRQEELRKTSKKNCQDRLSPGRDFNLGPPTYDGGVWGRQKMFGPKYDREVKDAWLQQYEQFVMITWWVACKEKNSRTQRKGWSEDCRVFVAGDGIKLKKKRKRRWRGRGSKGSRPFELCSTSYHCIYACYSPISNRICINTLKHAAHLNDI